jgi:hypothetical protein
VPEPDGALFDLVVVTAVHDETEHAWLAQSGHVLDATYRVGLGRRRDLV